MVGFLGAIPPGPVGLAVLRLGLEEGRAAGIRAGFGALLVDVPCVFLAAGASGWLVGALDARFAAHPVAVVILRLAVAALLLGLGARWVLRPHRPDPDALPAASSPAVIVGMGLAVAHLASPTFLPWLALIAGGLQARGLVPVGLLGSLAFTAGFGAGTFAWFAALATIAERVRERARAEVVVAAERFAGATLIVFAAVLVFETLGG